MASPTDLATSAITAAPSTTPAKSHFMALPPELRLMIYDHLLPASLPKRHLNILATCKFIQKEAESYLYDTTTTFQLSGNSLSCTIKSPLNLPRKSVHVGWNIWHFVRYFQSKMPILRKYRGIRLDFTLLKTAPDDKLPVPIDGLLYILGSLLDGSSALKTLEIAQRARKTDGEESGSGNCQYQDVPFIRPEVKVTFSSSTASTRLESGTVAAKKKVSKEMPAKNVLLQWITLKREVRDLFDLKVHPPGGKALFWRLIVTAEAQCAGIAALGRFKSSSDDGMDPVREGVHATLVQEALEKPLAELRKCVKAYEDVKSKQIAAKSA